MYAALFRKLPGNKILKWLQLFSLALVAVLILFTMVFPYVETLIAEDSSVNDT